MDGRHTRAVMFPDPYGMGVEWATLLAIAATKTIEVWFLFSLPTGDTSQQRYRAQQAQGDHSHSWHRCVERARRTCSQRTADVRRVERYVKARLQTIFAKGFEPLALPIDQRPQRSRCRNLYRYSRPGRRETARSGSVTRPEMHVDAVLILGPLILETVEPST